MVGVLANHWHRHPNVLDGVFWDHFNMILWVPDELPGVEGELDLDGDGIAHREDEDEIEAYRQASEDLIREFRNALGDDVIQIAERESRRKGLHIRDARRWHDVRELSRGRVSPRKHAPDGRSG